MPFENSTSPPRRQLGSSQLWVTPLGMGCWPIAGVTSIDVTEADSLETLAAAADAGLNFFDTAYVYGYQGESECLVARALGHLRSSLVIATKAGLEWGPDKKQFRCGRPEIIRQQCDASLRRLQTDVIDLYYLHAPDPAVPIAESAGAFRELQLAGKIREVGASNLNVQQLAEFHAVAPLCAVQPMYNMLQREIEADVLPWCRNHNVAVVAYWPLMKGLLAGQLSREHQFDERDGRRKYPMFHGEEWQKNQDFLDHLRPIAAEHQVSVAQVVLNWTIARPGITVALCGAKRAYQIRDNAAALRWQLSAREIATIDAAITARGDIHSKAPV